MPGRLQLFPRKGYRGRRGGLNLDVEQLLFYWVRPTYVLNGLKILETVARTQSVMVFSQRFAICEAVPRYYAGSIKW